MHFHTIQTYIKYTKVLKLLLISFSFKVFKKIVLRCFFCGREEKKADNGIRTHDLLLTRQMLYQLSYTGCPLSAPPFPFSHSSYHMSINNCLNRLSVVVLETSILNINSIQKCSQVFLLDDCSLLDAGTSLRNLLQINSLQSDVVLFLLFLWDDNSFWCVNPLIHLKSQEVFYFDGLQ